MLRDGEFCFYADEDVIEPLWRGKRFPLDTCISGWAMRHRRSVVIDDIYQDDRIPHDAYRPTFVRSLARVPIRSADPIGAIGNYWATHHRTTDREIQLLQALADSTSVAMENVRVTGELEDRVRQRTGDPELANAEVRGVSSADELTGLHNRRGFLESAESAWERAVDRRARCTVVFVCGRRR